MREKTYRNGGREGSELREKPAIIRRARRLLSGPAPSLDSVPSRLRLAISVSLGLLAAHFSYVTHHMRTKPTDFAQVWYAARVLLQGGHPYATIGPGRAFDFPYPFLYPLPAAVVAIPVASLTEYGADVTFALLGGTALAWALMKHGYGPLFGFFSASTFFALWSAQWSPLLTAAVVVAPLSVLFAAKPTIATALFCAHPNRWAVVGGVALCAISFVLEPHWVADWLGAVQANRAAWAPDQPYRAPVTLPGGIFALACLARWRRPEARLVAALACVPQTLILYETVPLFLVPKRFWEAASLLVGSYAVLWWASARLPIVPNLPLSNEMYGRAIVVALYLPATLLVLARPNEGPIPAWLERRVASWPAWLRGASTMARGT